MKTMAWGVIDSVVLVVLGTTAPSQEDWSGFLALVRQQGLDATSHVIVTEGGEWTSTLRRQLGAELDGRSVPTAILTDCVTIRGKVKVLGLFQPIDAFAMSERFLALEWLKVPRMRQGLILTMLVALQQKLHADAQEHGR